MASQKVVICKSKSLPAADGKTSYNLKVEFTVKFDHNGYYDGSYFKFFDEAVSKPILSESSSLYWVSSDIVGIADSEDAEDGEIAYQLFDVKRLPLGHMLVFHKLCEKVIQDPNPDYRTYGDQPVKTEVLPYFKKHEKDTPQIIGAMFELLGEAVDEMVQARFKKAKLHVPIYIAFLVGSKEYFPFDCSITRRVRHSVKSISTIGIGENSLVGSEGCTVMYHKVN